MPDRGIFPGQCWPESQFMEAFGYKSRKSCREYLKDTLGVVPVDHINRQDWYLTDHILQAMERRVTSRRAPDESVTTS